MPNFKESPCPRHSPWDAVHHAERLAPGLYSVSTASHGGLWLSPERMKVFRELFPTFEGYAGLPWLEEDCDICMGVIAFYHDFSAASLDCAVNQILTYQSDGEYYFREGRHYLLSQRPDLIRNPKPALLANAA